MARPEVVIVGGGFAGLVAAQRLGSRHAVTLIDRTPDFEFLPNLHELVSRSKRPDSLRLSRARLLGRCGHAFLQAEVVEIDPRRRLVKTRTGVELGYDALIVAAGSAAAASGVPGVREHALALRSVAEGTEIGRRLRRLARDGGSRTVTVVGGGFTGVECLGEILRRYRHARRLRIRVVEPRGRLLAGQPRVVHRTLRRLLRDFDVELLAGESVAALEPGRLLLASGSALASDLTLWTAGGAPPPLLARAGLARAGAWADTRPTLQSAEHDDVFLAGDAAQLARGVGKQSYHATAMGRRAAGNVARLLAGREPRRYSPDLERRLVTFGYLTGFYIEDGLVLASAALCFVRELLFQLGMLELERSTGRKAQRRLRQRLTDAARLCRWPDALRTLLPQAVGRDGWAPPAMPQVLEWRRGTPKRKRSERRGSRGANAAAEDEASC